MARVNLKKYDEGRFRLSVVTITGDIRTKIYTSWQKCCQQFQVDCKDETVQYAIIINQGDMNEAYWTVKDEYHRVWKPTLY